MIGDGLDLGPEPVLGAVQCLAPRSARNVVALEGHFELLQNEVVRILYEEHLGEERVQSVLVVDPGDADLADLAGPDVGKVDGLIEQRVRGVPEAFLQGAPERLDHHIGRVVDKDVSFSRCHIAVPDWIIFWESEEE